MTDSRGRAAPGAGDTHRGLALPGRGDLGGNAAHIIKQSKGAQNRPVPRPFLSFLKVPTARKEKISNPGQIRDTPASSRKKSPAEAGPKGKGYIGYWRKRGFRSRTIQGAGDRSNRKGPAEAGPWVHRVFAEEAFRNRTIRDTRASSAH